MNIFARPAYDSEFTQFLNAWKQRDPAVQENQRIGLALLWDKPPVNLEERRRATDSAVKRSAYVYE